MRTSMAIVAACAMLAGCATAARTAREAGPEPSASVRSPDVVASAAGVWRGTVSELADIYTGPANATVMLDLKPDGTYTQVWSEKGKDRTETGRWSMRGNHVVLEGTQPHTKRMLRYSGDALYGVTTEALPAEGRVGTDSISLRRAT